MAKTRKITIDTPNPFNTIAQTAATAKAETTTVPIAEVTEEIQDLIVKVLDRKTEIARLTAEQAQYEATIIDHVRNQQDDKAYAGKYSHSYKVPGKDNRNLLFITADSFSVDQAPETLTALINLLGIEKYNSTFKKKRTVTLKEGLDENQVLISKILKAVTDAGMTLGEVFKVVDKVVPVKELDVNQYAMVPKEQLPEWRSLCKQNKPSLKATK